MPTEKLPQLRKELLSRPSSELVQICLDLAKLKSDNKEMLAYLLFDREDPMAYARERKDKIDDLLENATTSSHQALKVFRKAFGQVTKYSRFTKSKPGEVELLLHTLKRFLEVVSPDTRFMPLLNVAFRALRKAHTLIGKLHEDLRYDYSQEYNGLLRDIQFTFRHWDHYRFSLPRFAEV